MEKKNLIISIIIVAWNAADYLNECLDSIQQQDYPHYQVIAVNNGSTDATSRILCGSRCVDSVISLETNHGFCHANNLGIQCAKGEIILTLNADMHLAPDFLANAVETISTAGVQYAMFQPKVLCKDAKTIDTTGLILSRAIRFFDRGNGIFDYGQYDTNQCDFFGPCGCAAFYKKNSA